MNLFEKVKNIRKDLQEKKKFPGDESGAYKAAKDDLEARKGFNKNKPGGLKADEKNPFVKRSVRKSRVDKLGGDIYDAPKFSQKKFDKSIGGSKKLTDVAAPGSFGKGDTKGQMNVKAMDKKAFKITKPKDVKLPKSFTDFQKNLQDYKDRDKATMRTGKSSSQVKVSGAENLTRQDVGMAPPDRPKTKVVKQSEVSTKAKDFTRKIDADKKIKDAIVKKSSVSKVDSKMFKDFEADAKFAKNKFRKQVDKIAKNPKLTGSEKATKSRSVMRNVKGAAEVEKGYKLASKGKGTPGVTPIAKAKDLKAVTSSAKVTVNRTLGKRAKPSSKFRKIIDRVRTSKIGSKVIKGLSKSRYGKIAGVALGTAGALAGISALSRRKPQAGTLTGKDIVRGPSIRNLVKNNKGNLVAGEPKRFQLGKKVTADDLKNTTFTRKLTDKQLTKLKINNKNT